MESAKRFHIESDQGIKLAIYEWGGEHTVATVFLHGLGEGGFVWNGLAQMIASFCRVVVIDLRGHGNSDRSDSTTCSYDIPTYVDDVYQVLEELRLSQFILIGHSLGGDVAARMLKTKRASATALVLVDAGPSINHDGRLQLHDRLVTGYRSFPSVAAYRNWLSETRALTAMPVLHRLAEDSLICTPSGFWPKYDVRVADILLAANDDSGWWWPTLRELELPVLIVRGIGSALLTRQVSEEMLRSLKLGRLNVIKGAGHSVMTDNPSDFLNSLINFITSVSSAGRPVQSC